MGTYFTLNGIHAEYPGLIEALFEGLFESPLWTRFLDRLRAATGADYAVLNSRRLGRSVEDTLDLLSGNASPSIIQQVDRTFFRSDPSPSHRLMEAKVYSLDELFVGQLKSQSKALREFLTQHGITAIRQMRVREITGVD